MPAVFLSLCCQAPVQAAGLATRYYICSQCREACEWTVRSQDTADRGETAGL